MNESDRDRLRRQVGAAAKRCDKELDRLAGTAAYRTSTYETLELAKDALRVAELLLTKPPKR